MILPLPLPLPCLIVILPSSTVYYFHFFNGMDISFGFLSQLLWTFSRVMCSVTPVPTVYEQEIDFVDSFRLTWTICTVIPTLSGCGGANKMVGRWSALQEMHILKSLWCWEMPSCRGDESFLGSCFARWFCCLEHCWGLSSFSSISSLIVVSLIIMFITSVCFFYLICTFSCVNLRFCFRCLHLRSLTSPFPLQTELQICGAMLKLL